MDTNQMKNKNNQKSLKSLAVRDFMSKDMPMLLWIEE